MQTYKVDTYKLMAKFEDEKEWQQRGTIEASKDSTGKIIDVEVSNNDISTKSNAVEQ